ncbi:hypothetical protein KAR91_71945 [Candidatus Pacearchaeota archaeon]|nr:hypothetical protein [Candidatus Pacearchaeota archaeon]
MGTISMIASYMNDSRFMFSVECLTNLIAVIGVVLFLVKFRSRWWLVSFISLVVGEIYLLTVDINLTNTDIIFICVVFAPAIYWNYLVTQVQRKTESDLIS